MRKFFIKYKLNIAGLIIGAIAGYLYYFYVGCISGSCPLSSNPWTMTFYGSIMGYLFFDLFKSKKTRTQNSEDEINNSI